MTRHFIPAAILVGLATMSSSAYAGIGEETAQAMTRQYNDSRETCPENAPAFSCTGILLRATNPSPDYHTWEHSPNTERKGAVSFSYMRDDFPVFELPSEGISGYTLAPENNRASDTLSYEILCAFPTDGDSDNRTERGCGDNSRTPQTEKLCHLQGVHEPYDWLINHINAPVDSSESYRYQCAFDVSESRGAARAQTFWNVLLTMKGLGTRAFPWNELMVKTWDKAQGHRLPIQSFFYIRLESGSLVRAQHDQRDFHATTGRFVPIIQIDLGREKSKKTTFAFISSDQVVNEPQ